MKKIHIKLALATATTAVLAFSGVSTASAADLRLASQQPSVNAELAADTDGMYIVRLTDAPVATYNGGIDGYKGTSASANGQKRLDTKSKAAQKYKKYLQNKQRDVLDSSAKAFGRHLNPKYDYQHAINGFAIELTATEAKNLRGVAGVASVQRERMENLLTDAGPAWIGAPTIWNAGGGTKGEGLVVAILDSGINSDHPSFADVGSDGYDHINPLGSGNYVPGSYCVANPGFCNDKLIGAWDMVQTAADPTSPEDSDGHGSHTASTAAGNVVDGAELVAPTTSAFFDISGVAPHANIIAYDVCVDGCPGAALVAAINQVLIDAGNLPNGIASLNYSISGGGNPYNDTVELGFLSAVAAGVYVSASAGNSGPAASTVAHLGPWVSTTAASTHNRAIANELVDMTSDGASLGDLSGSSFSAGYGPAPIIHANTTAFDPTGQCLTPFPAGTFTNEIVVCDRGTIARTAKGQNVLAGGAGGYVLANLGQGESTVADAHFLPAIHIGDTDGVALRAWLASNTGTVATITPFGFDLDPGNGDIMADFSSRGPQTAFDVLKPDVTAPGVDIMGAEANGQAAPPEYQIISGTSMSSPHNAGAGALMTGYRPDWSPQAIKSAIMMTSSTMDMVKEDGSTPADPFDHGAGRIDLTKAGDAGLVLNESIGNFVAANPDLGGDPSKLNIASMMDSNCVGKCEFRRTVTGVNAGNNKFDLSSTGPAGLTVNPTSQIVVGKNKTKTVIVRVDSTFADRGWNFGELQISPQKSGPDLHMPIAVFAADSTNSSVLNKSVDVSSDVEAGDTLTYEIAITNGQMAGDIELTDMVPAGTTFVPASETEVLVGGTSSMPFAYDGLTNSLSWTGELDQSGLVLAPSGTSPAGYTPLSLFGVSAYPFPGNCDDGASIFNVPAFDYNGATYGQIIWSVNGTVEVGTASGLATSFANQNLPDPTAPNNLLAPFWRDLNGCAGGSWSIAVLGGGGGQWLVLEWKDVPHFGSADAASFQIWIGTNASAFGNTIHYTYGRLDNTGVGATVGVENSTGSVGDSYFYNGAGTAPAVGADLEVLTTLGGSATLGFEVTVDECNDPGIANEVRISNHGNKDRAIATSTCAAP